MSESRGGAGEAQEVVARLRAVRARVRSAAQRAGRDPSLVRLLAVSKLQPASKLRAAYAEGQRDFGENYAQELLGKNAELADLPDVRWHMIGGLQRNKCAALAGVVSAVHSVDSVRLVRELGKRAAERRVPEARQLAAGGRLLVFLQMNLAGEEQKGGAAPDQLDELIAAVQAEAALALGGLMIIPAGNGDSEASRAQFEALQKLREQHGGAARLPGLSMGMSRDLEVAIACGSGWVRVGTDIFGARA
ncbi:MAG TPA: YggS family pyridoxal phosphate-dependent enzyme [Polyangiaceae bacterium]|nr:YggS family pyridoxal phosphate-dependent enzyme [Polyangiaceae bacterium]